jgi:Putative auto-transporter adhesin, head GIN domain
MKKQVIFSAALVAAMFTSSFTATAQEAPAKKADKKEKSKKESYGDNWNSSGWGGERVVGTGDVVSETRDISGFTGVSSGISADIELRQNSTFKVSIDGQKNIIDLVEMEVKDGTLKIRFKKGYSMTYKKTLKIRVEAPSFAYLGMSGSGNVRAEGALTGEKLDISISGSGDFDLMQLKYADVKVGISGSGDVDLGGSVERAELSISGSGDLKAKDLKAQSVRCRVSGSGDVSCFAAKELDASVSGSGDIRYSGNPASVKKKVSGSGDIEAK